MQGHVLIPHLLTMTAVKTGFYIMSVAMVCFFLANTDNMSIPSLFQTMSQELI